MSPNEPYPRLDRTETETLLNRHGITPTQQRVEIAAVLLAAPQHISAEALLERVNGTKSLASKATVYNTLGLFASHGLVKEVKVDRSKVFYDSNPRPHHHFYDTTTGELTDFAPEDIDISKHPSPPEGTSLDEIEVIIRVSQKN